MELASNINIAKRHNLYGRTYPPCILAECKKGGLIRPHRFVSFCEAKRNKTKQWGLI